MQSSWAPDHLGGLDDNLRPVPVTLSRLKTDAVIVVFAGCMVLNYSFLAIRIPPSATGIPIGELVLVLYLVTMNWPRVLTSLAATGVIFPVLAWWIFGFTRLIADSLSNGLWAFRDATQVIESLYLLVGFVIAGQAATNARFFGALRLIMIAVSLYAVTMIVPGVDRIAELAPTLPGASGQAVPLIGIYSNTGPMLLWIAASLLLVRDHSGRIGVLRIAIAATMIVVTIVVLQERTTYVQLVLLMAMLVMFRRGTLLRMGTVIPVFLLAVGVLELAQVELPGRLTNQVSFDFFLDHIKAMFGISDSRELAGAAKGVGQRLRWWSDIYDRVTVDAFTTATGLGYGTPLINFGTSEGVMAREPHNSIISVAARLGVVGLVFWVSMQIALFRAWHATLTLARRLGQPRIVDRLFMLLAYFVVVLGMAYGEDAFEKPYFAIPYYFFWGVILRLRLDLRAANAVAEVPFEGHWAPVEGSRTTAPPLLGRGP